MNEVDPEAVLAFWLGPLDEHGRASEAHAARWWNKSAEFDAECRAKFEAVHASICEGGHASWLSTARGYVAFIVVLDQLSRNMFRGSARMYEADPIAARTAVEAIDRGLDAELGYHERYFLYMPLMHAEALPLQERCVAVFESMRADFAAFEDNIAQAIRYAEQHRDIVARFGRFPHRNAILGRESTDEERRFLEQPGSSF